MIILHQASDLSFFLENKRKSGVKTGFVPTMGALHAGHIDLLKKAKATGDFAVVSIFVNPTQFNDPKDFEKYPITIEADIRLLLENDCDLLFLPSVNEIYPYGTAPQKLYDLGHLESLWEGYYRPGHFQGVCQVVERLLHLVKPNNLYMGLKDYQQCMVVRRLLEITDSSLPTILVPCPTLREKDGLAMSSRNRRLTAEFREKAPLLFHTLQQIKADLATKPASSLLSYHRQRLTEAGFKLDYLALVDAFSLQEIANWNGRQKAVLIIAAFAGDVRLIDNLLLI